jgi:curli biogenesis system outer membrane secretion channel CsgG
LLIPNTVFIIENLKEIRKRSSMRYIFKNSLSKNLLFFVIFIILTLSTGCSTIKGVIYPSEKSVSPSRSTVQKEDYKGPKVKVVVTKFIDRSSKGKMSAQNKDRMAEMLGNALLATNRFIVQMRSSVNGSKQTIKRTDLLIEGSIMQFEPGSGLIIKTQSRVTFLLKVSEIKTGRRLIFQNVEGKAIPMEEAIKKAIEESVEIIVAKIPSEYYQISSTPTTSISSPSKESPKPPKTQPEVTSLPPTPPAVKSEPSLRITRVIWRSVNLREGPGTSYKVIGKVKRGTSLGILEVREDWLCVRLEDGSEAWVIRSATSETPKPPSPAAPSPPTPTTTPSIPLPM